MKFTPGQRNEVSQIGSRLEGSESHGKQGLYASVSTKQSRSREGGTIRMAFINYYAQLGSAT